MAKSEKSDRGKTESKSGPGQDPESIVAGMVACTRCSVFLVGYRLISDDWEQAVSSNTRGMIRLSWNSAIRKLLVKSYGCDIDVDMTSFKGICPECQRYFSYESSEKDQEPDVFLIATTPG